MKGKPRNVNALHIDGRVVATRASKVRVPIGKLPRNQIVGTSMKANIKIVSGGQTGVDQGALEAAVQLGLSSAFVLNVAGPRESKAPGIQVKTKAFLSEVVWEV